MIFIFRSILIFQMLAVVTMVPAADRLLMTAHLEFQRIYMEKGHADTVGGELLFEKEGRTRIIVNLPVKQRMTLEGKTMIIFYPQEGKAFRVIGRSVFDLPFFQAFLTALQPREFLEKQGFVRDIAFDSSASKSERWLPPSKARKAISAIRMDFNTAVLKQVTVYGPSNEKLLVTHLEDYHMEAGRSFPGIIQSVNYKKGHESKEILRINTAVFDGPLDRFDAEFKIPLDIKIKEIRL